MWTADDWVKVLKELTPILTAIAAVIAAWRSNQAAKRIEKHEENARDRAAGDEPRNPRL